MVVLSLGGGGVQSTVMALMAAHGEIVPMPDVAIFANTQSDADGIYDHVAWLDGEVPFEILMPSAGSCEQDAISGINSTGQDFTTLPAFRPYGGMGRRQCTREYKLTPIKLAIREFLGVAKGRRVPKGMVVEQWIGISTDEIGRVAESRDRWARNRWPLIELGMSRLDCVEWFTTNYPGRALARSACVFCPMQHDREWRAMKANDPESFERACLVDDALNKRGEYVHRACKPLRSIDFTDYQIDLFARSSAMQCDGGCFT